MLWVRSYSLSDQVRVPSCFAWSGSGQVLVGHEPRGTKFGYSRHVGFPRVEDLVIALSNLCDDTPLQSHRLGPKAGWGFWWNHYQNETIVVLSVPHWGVAGCFALLPLCWLARRLRTIMPGRCSTCGYCLTGNTSGVCPECSTPVEAKAEVKG